jgi:hypothetical protein
VPKDGEEEEVEEEVEISGMAGNVVVGCMPRGVARDDRVWCDERTGTSEHAAKFIRDSTY